MDMLFFLWFVWSHQSSSELSHWSTGKKREPRNPGASQPPPPFPHPSAVQETNFLCCKIPSVGKNTFSFGVLTPQLRVTNAENGALSQSFKLRTVFSCSNCERCCLHSPAHPLLPSCCANRLTHYSASSVLTAGYNETIVEIFIQGARIIYPAWRGVCWNETDGNAVLKQVVL